MKFPSITDSRGNKSQTLFWVVLALVALFARFIAGMFTDMGQVDPTSFAMAFTTILAPWITREGIDKLTANPSGSGSYSDLPPGA